MGTVALAWSISAAAMLLLALLLGVLSRGRLLGILLDSRGRYSLAQFQLLAWVIVVLSLVSGVFWGRLLAGVADPFDLDIPAGVLGTLGVSLASTMMSAVVKASKDATYPECVAASDRVRDLPRVSQIFMQEEGPLADRVVDVTKFQQFLVTLVLVVGYVALAVHTISGAGGAAHLTGIPDLSGAFLALFGISHAGYLVGKLPVAGGGNPAPGLTVALLPGRQLPANPRNPPRGVAGRTGRGRRERQTHAAAMYPGA